MLLSFNWIRDLNWIIGCHSILQAKWKVNALLSSVVTFMLPILSIFLQYIPVLSIYILQLFRALWILAKNGSKLDKKRTRFSTLRAPVPTHVWFSIVFPHWNAYNQGPPKKWTHLSSFQIFFGKSVFDCFPSKFNLKIYQKKPWARFCTAAC